MAILFFATSQTLSGATSDIEKGLWRRSKRNSPILLQQGFYLHAVKLSGLMKYSLLYLILDKEILCMYRSPHWSKALWLLYASVLKLEERPLLHPCTWEGNWTKCCCGEAFLWSFTILLQFSPSLLCSCTAHGFPFPKGGIKKTAVTQAGQTCLKPVREGYQSRCDNEGSLVLFPYRCFITQTR